MSRASRRTVWIVFALAAFLLFSGPWLAFPAMGWFLVKAEPPQPADAAVVLAGDGTGLRVLEGAKLARAGLVPKVFVDGPDYFYGLHESDLAIPFAVRAGYPQSIFVPIPTDAHSTREEAAAVAAVLRQHGVRSIDLVTSSYHTRRSGALFRAVAPDIRITVVAAPDKYFTPDGWWKHREARKTFLLEWAKTLADSVGGL